MKDVGNSLTYSAYDLSNHLGCRHLTQLDRAVAEGRLEQPEWRDPALAALQIRGIEFEQEYLNYLQSQGMGVSLADEQSEQNGAERTRNAMATGADVIYQGVLSDGPWSGRADFLKKVDRPSQLGGWSYEVIDTKLARETRAGTIVQLCLYSQILGDMQGILPEHMYVIIPGEPFDQITYRTEDFISYQRLIQRRLLDAGVNPTDTIQTYPEPVSHCDVCRWWANCDKRRRDDDHLCLVAGVSKLQIAEIRRWDVNTLAELAELPLPLPQRPSRGAIETFERAREQARVQLEARNSGERVFELLPIQENQGLCRLPEPSDGDIFFDIEADQFAGTHGLEYLFGWLTIENGQLVYHKTWAHDVATEKAVFQGFLDFVSTRIETYPDLHVYHFSGYEPGALKRLMGRYVTREDELDRLLRGKRLIDLHGIAKQAVRASVERYSLKDLEAFYEFERDISLRDATLHLRAFECALEFHRLDQLANETRPTIEGYNREDCASTLALRDWLEELRSTAIANGDDIPRPILEDGAPSEELDEHQLMILELYERLAGDVPIDSEERNPEEQARWLLANMLDWHRREKKAAWWEYFRLVELSDDDLLYEKSALAGLEFADRIATPARSVVDRYRFTPQECELRAGDSLKTGSGENFGKIEAIDTNVGTVDIRKGPSIKDFHPSSIFKHENFNDRVKHDAIMRIANWVADNGIDADGDYRAGRDLLRCAMPRPGADLIQGEVMLSDACAWVENLDQSVLPIQGPPGAGKTYTGARMITHLVRQGKKVGIVALSHKVIRNLLDEVIQAAEEKRLGDSLKCLQKVRKKSEDESVIIETTDNAVVDASLANGSANVVGGTSWLWAREELCDAVDVLFVDEAGQLSLVDVLAVSQSAKNLVLLGDPQQLKQPVQGSHPDGTEVSALEHMLGEDQTIPKERGLFLDQTFRMHPEICNFVSEQYYDGRLTPRPDLNRQSLSVATEFSGSGLWFEPVPHQGNQSSSPEEVERIVALVESLTSGDVIYKNKENEERGLELDDILIIAPYNAQVALLSERIPMAKIGTVDKFQGQEAPIVICSMSTSSPEEAPRGMEFLYSRNRLNVAVSRARAACIIVGSPKLFEPDCNSPAQIRLANGFCRYLELTN